MKSRAPLLACFATSVVAAACSGGGGGGSKELTSGVYTISGFTSADACDFLPDLGFADGATRDVIVDGPAVTVETDFGDVATTLTGTAFSGQSQENVDWSGSQPPYDCVEQDTYSLAGTVTGTDRAELSVTVTWTVVSGTGCNLANAPITLPCTSTSAMDLSK